MSFHSTKVNEDAEACETSTICRGLQGLSRRGFRGSARSQVVQPARNLPGPRVCIVSVRFVARDGHRNVGLVLTILWRWGQQAGSKRAHVRGALALFSGLHAIRSIVTSAVHFCSIIFCQGLSVFFEMSVLEGARRRQGCAPELELLDDGNYVFTLPTSSNRLPSCLVRAHGVRYYTLLVAMVVLASSVYEVFHAVVGDPFFGKRR